jgi:hypothetical protein
VCTELEIKLKSSREECAKLDKQNHSLLGEITSMRERILGSEDAATRMKAQLDVLQKSESDLWSDNKMLLAQIQENWDNFGIENTFSIPGSVKGKTPTKGDNSIDPNTHPHPQPMKIPEQLKGDNSNLQHVAGAETDSDWVTTYPFLPAYRVPLPPILHPLNA